MFKTYRTFKERRYLVVDWTGRSHSECRRISPCGTDRRDSLLEQIKFTRIHLIKGGDK